MEDQWTKYLSKAGKTLFVYNKATGEHRWPVQDGSEIKQDTITDSQPILYKECSSVAIQTDDTGCINGCTSALAQAGCVSARASVVEVRMDDLDMSERPVNSTRAINTSPERSVVLSKTGTNVSALKETSDMTECQTHNPLRNQNSSNNIDTASKTIGSSLGTSVIVSSSNKTTSPDVPVQSTVNPAKQGFISGALYLGNGKFANILLPANNPASPILNPTSYVPTVVPGLQHGLNSVPHKKIELRPGPPLLSTSALLPISQQSPTKPKEPSSQNDSYSVNGMIANVQRNAKDVNSNLSSAVHIKSPSVIVSQNATHKVQPSKATSSQSNASVENANHTSTVSSSSRRRKSTEPKQIVISNVFSCLADSINPESGETEEEGETKKSNNCANLRIERVAVDSQGICKVDGTVKVKIEPGTGDTRREAATNHVYKCPHCPKTFSNSSGLLVHQRYHTGDKPYKCPHCDKEFRHNSSLKVHVKLHTGEKPYKCCSCDRTFRQKVHLRNHLRTHTEDNKFKCTYCDKGFRHKGNLIAHLLTHSTERPYKCHDCDRTFTQKAHLESHEQSHCKRKHGVCPYCNKEFKFGSSLALHMRTHTGEKPFKCSLCDMTFRQKQHLIVHVRRHTGEKPFKCIHCNKAFRHDTALRSHLLIHPESQYSQAQAAMFTEEQRMGNIE